MKFVAEFNADEQGKPLSISDGSVEHFSIALKLTEIPKGVQRVTYLLHPTYHRPVRTVPARIPDFEEPITAYGDYEVTVKYEHDGTTQQLTRLLSAALEDGSAGATHQAVAAAISKIRSL
jgi:hypothetical protein